MALPSGSIGASSHACPGINAGHGGPEMLPADLTDGVATQEGDRDAEVLWRGRTQTEGGSGGPKLETL
jgi:hypothetical protein